MKHAVSQELFDYWNELRGARNAPERSDLDPAAIRGILADTFVLEVVDGVGSTGRTFPVRLSGTRINALFMDEVKGRSIVSLWWHGQQGLIEDMLDGVLEDQVATVAGVRTGPGETSGLDLELLLLPLRHHGRTHSRILGSLAPMRVPSWLGLRPVDHLEVTSMRTVTSPAVPMRRLSAALPASRGRPPVRHGHFTVYEGGR